MGAMSKSSNSGQSLDNSSSTGDLLGSLMGGSGIDMDDVLNLAKKFF
jgi:hypothetical protein